jgi:hypothetical protein
MVAVVPASWMPTCEMKHIVMHWTAGGYRASENDKEHYHILIEEDGRLVRGDFSILDNVSTRDDIYAAHTKGFNSQAIGVAVCCMREAVPRPFDGGPCPMLELQWITMAAVVADLARRYGIACDEQHILGHGEVQRVHNIPQRGKWDPMVLPWKRELSPKQAGDLLRTRVADLL